MTADMQSKKHSHASHLLGTNPPESWKKAFPAEKKWPEGDKGVVILSQIDYFAIHIVPRMYRGKGALHPAPTGKLTDVVSCVREYDVNVFFLSKGETLIAIDAGYKSHPGLLERCRKIDVDPARVQALFLTHADPDHTGGLDIRQDNHFQNARVYVGELEENYLTNTWHRKQIGPFGLKNSVTIADGYHLLKYGETVQIGDFKVQAFLVPGHTLGHLCYLIDDTMLFTGDSIALNKEGGWRFFDIFKPNKIVFSILTRLYPGRPKGLYPSGFRYRSISISSMISSNANTGSQIPKLSARNTGNLPCFGL